MIYYIFQGSWDHVDDVDETEEAVSQLNIRESGISQLLCCLKKKGSVQPSSS